MATYLKGAVPPPGSQRLDGGPLMPLREMRALAAAPRKAGTQVIVRSYEVPNWPGRAEHMYVEYDDGQDRLIARGGPSHEGLAMAKSFLADDLHVTGDVGPERLSRDLGKGERVLFDGFLPNESAGQASASAARQGQGLTSDPRRYGYRANSNSYAADAVESRFGVRPGDKLTPGWQTRLATAPRLSPNQPSKAEPLRRRWHPGAGGSGWRATTPDD